MSPVSTSPNGFCPAMQIRIVGLLLPGHSTYFTKL
jgi:hypothetical protein